MTVLQQRKGENTKSRQKKGRKTKKRKGKKSRAGWKRNGKHGPAYYFNCVIDLKTFLSRIKKASNLERQAKRIEAFRILADKKMAKV